MHNGDREHIFIENESSSIVATPHRQQASKQAHSHILAHKVHASAHIHTHTQTYVYSKRGDPKTQSQRIHFCFRYEIIAEHCATCRLTPRAHFA